VIFFFLDQVEENNAHYKFLEFYLTKSMAKSREMAMGQLERFLDVVTREKAGRLAIRDAMPSHRQESIWAMPVNCTHQYGSRINTSRSGKRLITCLIIDRVAPESKCSLQEVGTLRHNECGTIEFRRQARTG
jgi:hypothetical protein